MNPSLPRFLKRTITFAAFAAFIIGVHSNVRADGVGDELYKKARAAEQAENIDLAIRLYSRAIEAGDLPTTQLAYAYHRRASLWAQFCEIGRAIEDFTKTIELHPTYGSAYSLRAYLRGLSGQYELAEKDHLSAINLAAKSEWKDYLPWVLQHYADMWRRRGSFEKALANCDRALKVGDYAVVYFRRAWIHLDMGEFGKAQADFAKFKLEVQRQRYSLGLMWPDEQIAFNRLERLAKTKE